MLYKKQYPQGGGEHSSIGREPEACIPPIEKFKLLFIDLILNDYVTNFTIK